MYSRIPMPNPKWKEENRRYSLCFFPIIGAVCGALIILWYYICSLLEIGNFLFAAVSTAIPIAVTGGIHLDGFCDVSDARASCTGKEKMLEIMNDSHVGAFAVIKTVLYLILQTALFTEAFKTDILIIYSCGMVLSRALSGLAVVTFKSAKKTGTLQNFKKPAHKKITILSEIMFVISSGLVMIVVNPVVGAASIICAFISFVYYRVFSYHKFGGTTGDIAGYFLQICEFVILFGAVFANKIFEVMLK